MLVSPRGLNRVWFNPTAGALTDFTYSSALTGFQSPQAAGAVVGNIYSYAAQSADLTQWEEGVGTWGAGNVLKRTVIQFSSNANAKVNFSVVPTVFIDCRGEDVAQLADLLHSFGNGC
jgi:hypothetical protein